MENLTIQAELYGNQRIALRLICEDGEPYGALTTNIVEATVADDEVCIPAWKLEQTLLDGYLASGRFVDTGKITPTGFVQAPVWKVVCPELLKAIAELRQQREVACAVRGVLHDGQAICGAVINARLCGHKGDCEHQIAQQQGQE